MKIHGEQNKLVITIESHDTPENCAWLIDQIHLSEISQKDGQLTFISKFRKEVSYGKI